MTKELIEAFKEIRDNHRKAMRQRMAREVLGSSVIRVFESKTKQELMPLLAAIDIGCLTEFKEEQEYRAWFEKELSKLADAIKHMNPQNSKIYPGYKWGHAAKILNLFVSSLVLNTRYFADAEADRISRLLYVPIDSTVMNRLRQLGVDLPFTYIREIKDKNEFYRIQDMLGEAASQVGVPRIWFDDVWGQDRE